MTNRLEYVADITRSYWARNLVISMVQNDPPQHCAAGEGPPEPQDQGPDVPMPDAAGDGVPHGGQDQCDLA